MQQTALQNQKFLQFQQQISNFQNNPLLHPSQPLNLTMINNGQNFIGLPVANQNPLQVLNALQNHQKLQNQLKLLGSAVDNNQNSSPQAAAEMLKQANMNLSNLSNLQALQNNLSLM